MPFKMTKKDLTPKELSDLHACAQSVWQEICGDVLSAVAEDKGISVNRVTISRNEVVELVIDADRLEEHMRRAKLLTPALAQLFKTYDGSLAALVKAGFAFQRYGM